MSQREALPKYVLSIFFSSLLTSLCVLFFCEFFFVNFFLILWIFLLICVASSCRAAFQYGVKMKDGRKQGKSSSKSEKSKLNSEWNKISALIQKRKDGGEARYVYTTWCRAVRPCGAEQCARVVQSSAPVWYRAVRPCGTEQCARVVQSSAPLWYRAVRLCGTEQCTRVVFSLRGLLFYRFSVTGRVGLRAITNILIWGSTCDFAGVFVGNGVYLASILSFAPFQRQRETD